MNLGDMRLDELRMSDDCEFILCSHSPVLLLDIQKYLRERARSHTSNNIHSCTVISVKLHWYLGIFNFILKLRLYKLNTLSLLSAVTANLKMVYLMKSE